MEIRRRPPNPPVAVSTLQYRVQIPNASPRHILEEIVWQKEAEIDRLRANLPLKELQKDVLNAPPPRDFLAALRQSKRQPALIAEVKRASPSKGLIRHDFDPVAIGLAYAQRGAACISVLTDETFFQGSFDYLAQLRTAVDVPLLCKEFILYPYQMYLARTKGADAILLIAAILSDKDLSYFLQIAKALGMVALVEVHTQVELERVLALENVELLGINNRNLETFETSLETTHTLISNYRSTLQEKNILIVSESGIHETSDLKQVVDAGAQAILVGESLVKQPDPGQAIVTLYGGM